MEKIGLLGGTFNPPHLAHLQLARSAVEILHLDHLFWIPCKPWQKADQKIVDGHRRCAMVDLMLENESKMSVDTCEVDRTRDSYSIDTIKEIRARFPEATIYFVMGSDQWENFHTWKSWKEILKLVRLAIFTRNGQKAHCANQVQDFVDQEGIELAFLEMPAMSTSSQEIREIIAKEGVLSDKLAGKLARDVIKYIHTLGLYRKSP